MTDRDARLDGRLDEIRREIDGLDVDLLELFNRRARAVLRVAEVKGRRDEPRYYRPERESFLLRRLAARNEGPLPDAEVVRLFREIVSTCRTLEQRLVIGCTTVSEVCAAIGHFGGAVDIRADSNVAQALDAVAGGRCSYMVMELPAGGGAPAAILDLPDRGLMLCGEWYAGSGERHVVVGREPIPPTGDDWTSFAVPAQRMQAIGSWCSGSNLRMRSTPVEGRTSSIVDIAAHRDEPRLAPLVAELGVPVLGAYPSACPSAAGAGRG